MSEERLRFVQLASEQTQSITELCREFGISRQCGYTWLARYREGGASAIFSGRSRRPRQSPRQTAADIVAAIVASRRLRPDWGAGKLLRVLLRQHPEWSHLARSTVHRILVRHGLIHERDQHPPATGHFERNAPNELWQMDFKGPKGFREKTGPLSVLDDHSRYLLTLEHLENSRIEAMQRSLRRTFERNGLPEAMLMDHGTPWWNANSPWGWTELSVWLMRQGIRILLSGIRHPQTQGKVERMHQSLHRAIRRRKADADEQGWLDEFREEYNFVRPHEALGMETPSTRWQPSQRAYQAEPKAWEYLTTQPVVRLDAGGPMRWAGWRFDVSLALKNELVGIREVGSLAMIYYCNTPLLELNLENGKTAVLPVDPFRSLQC